MFVFYRVGGVNNMIQFVYVFKSLIYNLITCICAGGSRKSTEFIVGQSA